jgi:amino acid permease
MQTRFNAKHFVLIAILLLISFASNAQCAMCRAAIESEGNSEKAEAINDGIVYLMVIPYVLVGAIGYAIYRMRKNKKA